jgi:hypothetical protein
MGCFEINEDNHLIVCNKNIEGHIHSVSMLMFAVLTYPSYCKIFYESIKWFKNYSQ